MSKSAAFLLVAALAGLAGCRIGRYELKEPLDGRTMEVKSGDRVSVVLEENATTGFVWTTACDDGDVSFERETIPPDDDAPIGAPGKVRITMRFHRGFAETTHVTLAYRRPWKGGETARTIDLIFYRKPEDTAPWK